MLVLSFFNSMTKRKADAEPSKRSRSRSSKGRLSVARVLREYRKGHLHSFVRTFNAGSAAAGGGEGAYTINSLPSATEITNLFDQYRIRGFKLTWVPTQSVLEMGTAAQAIPRLTYVIDQDGGGGSPINENELLEYGNAKIVNLDKPYSVFYRPRALLYAGASGGFNTLAPRDAWIDMNSASLPHYGIRTWMSTIPSNMTITLYVRIYFECKYTR